MAETKKDAVKAFDAFVETYQVKYKRATDCLTKDRDALLAFYDFPAEHWKHLRRRTQLKAPLRPSGTALSGQKAFCRTRRRSPWSSSWSRAPREIGAGSTAIISYQN